MIELICQFANYTDEFVWWLRYAYVSPCVSAAFIDRKWIVECIPSVCIRVCAYGCVKILVNRVSIHVPLSIYLSILLLPGHRSVRGGTRLRVLTLDRASVRARGIGHT